MRKMIDKITQVHFKPDQDYRYGIRGLKQWDKGQKLEISGLDISDEIVEVHFSLRENQGEAKRMLATVENGIIYANIPAFVLEGPEYIYGNADTYSAYALIYLSDNESAKTIRKMEFKIKARPKPEEYVTPEELSFLQQLEAAMQNKLDKSGHVQNKFLGTDSEGNVVAKDMEGFSLEVASETKLGGVKPATKTDDMIQPVGVDKEGKLYTAESGIDEETFLKSLIKPTTEPSPFHHITDSAKAKPKIKLYGKTEQPSTEGNQLITYPYADSSKTLNGINFIDNGDGSITVKGTATAYCFFQWQMM